MRILVADVMRLHRELHERDYPYARPGVQTQPWGLEVAVIDPFANRLVFHQLTDDEPTEGGGTAAGPIEHEHLVACSPDARLRTCSPVRSASGGTRPTRRPA